MSRKLESGYKAQEEESTKIKSSISLHRDLLEYLVVYQSLLAQ